MPHGMIWAIAVSAAAFLLTARTAIATVSQDVLSAVLYTSFVYVWNPYHEDESHRDRS